MATHAQDINTYNQVLDTTVLTAIENGAGTDLLRWANKWVQVTGTFGGTTVTIQGSMDNSNWIACTTDGTTACTFAAAGAKKIFEGFKFFRAITTGGAGISVTVIIAGSA